MDLPGNFENLKTKRTGIQHQVDAVRKKMVGNFENLKTELGNLRRKRTRIQGQVDAARSKVEEIEEEVPKWLVRAKEIENNVQKLLNRTEEDEKNASNRCCPCLRPESKKRRQLRQEAVNLLQTVAEHLKAGKFDQISHPVIKGGEAFGSRASTLRDVIRSLSDPNVSTVGIYGMDGIGKTTLAKLVANHPETKYLFNWVIFVEVNEKPDETKIQREIGEKLGLPLSQEESSSTIAGKLCHRLRQEENILIILDNVWERLHLQAIGIPRRHEHKGCKLLLTARSVDVLSSKMDSQSNFKVHDLHHDEALRFFKKMAGDYIEGHDEFKSVATELANKCACSPIAIAIVARALKNKQLLVWKDFLQQVKMSSSKVVLYASIELSYKYLTREQQKTLLLIQYASLTSIDELLMYGMSLGLFDDIEEMEGRRARVKTFVQQLKDSCLLADGNTTPDDFSMHDIVRGIVKSIASRELCAFTYEGVAEREWPDGNTLKAYSSIVLKDVKAGGLPPVLECQQLKLLSISATDPGLFLDSCSSLKIHDDFFTKMTELKVLVLANMDLSSLPKSIRFLSNLQALGLYKCKLDDVAILGELKKLEILSLRNSKIDQLSAEVCHLIQLKLLDLRSTHVRVIPPNVISNLSTLEELYMGEFAWEKDGFDKARESASLNELNDLSKLTCLEIQINDSDALPSDLSFRKLERYKILIGSLEVWEFDRDWIWNFTSPNTCRKFQLSLVNTNICLNEGHIMQLKRIEDLCLVGLQDMKSVLHGLDKDGFLQLSISRFEITTTFCVLLIRWSTTFLMFFLYYSHY
ncbi:Disease resistance protein [Melia azedarach]|uniref:Disease resistance protein n=1 Tax=Melia azedarach TaxID=155640 RepID=A0ACC1YEW9_MELAZ|nr:Disease resistance protein [Melia azedarach]